MADNRVGDPKKPFRATPSLAYVDAQKLNYEEWEEQVRELLMDMEAEVLSKARVGFNQKEEEQLFQDDEEMRELSGLLLGPHSTRSKAHELHPKRTPEGVRKDESAEERHGDYRAFDEGENKAEELEPAQGGEVSDEFLDLTNREPEDLPFPYRLLDWRWYKRTPDDERIRQLLQWKPFSRRGAHQLAGEQAFKDNPFAAPSPIARTKWELEQYRRMRLEVFFSDQLGRLAELMDNAYKGQIVHLSEQIFPTIMTLEETTAALISDLRIIDRKIREAKLAVEDADRIAKESHRLENSPITEKERSM